MARLSMLDAGFLEAEDSDRHVSLAVAGLSILEGPIPDYHAILDGISERLLSIPRFRQVLRSRPFDLGAPDWVDDPKFNLLQHVRRAALPQPGDDRELFRFAADVMERRLDRDRPLWECWIIEGLADGRWAILMKIHHCIGDGIATMRMLGNLSDDGAGGTFANKIRAAQEPPHTPLRLPKVSLNPLNWATGARQAAMAVATAAMTAVQGTIELTSGLLNRAAPS